ncbi:MAG: dienelactone hydrolase family protein [Maricaulaceae bacterium]|nr:dienelactone hydrolase family protein [Maricaulaceae bacterium]
MGERITINTADGEFSAYRAAPEGGKGPAIVVIQEIFGVNKVMRDICDGLASEGWLAICPDLFWRIEPGVDITDKTQAEWDKAFDLFGKFKADTGIKDIAATIAHARAEGAAKVGAVGYCLGGLLAYLTACRTDCDAAAGYYGVAIPDYLDEAANIKQPLMLHMAGKDQFVPPEAQAKIRDGLKGHARVTLHEYPDCDHAFARVGGKHFDAAAAKLANDRTREFFKTHLGQGR